MSVESSYYRYSYPEMRGLFEEQSKLEKMLAVEIALARAHAKVGNIPKKDAARIAKGAKRVKVKRIKEIEKKIKHDTMSFVKAMTEKCGTSGKYIHFGATSYDITDTMWGLLFKDAIKVIDNDLAKLEKTLARLSKKHRNTIMLGRTHGQHAIPITFGFKTALWLSEIHKHRERLKQMTPRVCIGKMSGAVGTHASFGTTRIQRLVMQELKLNEPTITNQVVQREGFAEMLAELAIISATAEKIAKEVRNLSRQDIMEVHEAFGEKEVGSSTMPHKRNPCKSERICGLARVVRANSYVAFENIALEHERDLTNSSPERIVIPQSFLLTDFILRQMNDVLTGLVVNKKRMKQNLMADEFVMAESIMLALVKKGVGRQQAHEIVRKCAMKSYRTGESFKQALLSDKKVILSKKELDRAMDPNNYLGRANEVINKVLRETR